MGTSDPLGECVLIWGLWVQSYCVWEIEASGLELELGLGNLIGVFRSTRGYSICRLDFSGIASLVSFILAHVLKCA